MECNAYRILITGYIDEELSDDEKQLLKTHLQTCKACFAYLVRAEAMKTVLKRCKLLQDVPEVPPNFAQNISTVLRGIAEKEQIPLKTKVKKKYQEFVFGIIEKWVASLRTRPFAWMTSVSLLFVLIAGVVCVDIFQTVYQGKPLQYTQLSPKPMMQVAQKDTALPVEREINQTSTEAPAPAGVSELKEWDETEFSESDEGEPIQYVDISPVSPFRAAKRDRSIMGEKAKQSPVLEVLSDQPVEESFLQFAKNESIPLEDYVYSHVITVSQNQFIDDAVFVGYVQDALYQ